MLHCYEVLISLVVFRALRGGGAGSWGVIVSATFRTFPIFNATQSDAVIYLPTKEAVVTFAQIHAKHIFDWDNYPAGQYFYLINLSDPATPGYAMTLTTYFPNATAADAETAMKPLLDEAQAQGFVLVVNNVTEGVANDLLFQSDDGAGVNLIMGSRLIPERVYRENAEEVGRTYASILDDGSPK